MDDPIWKWTIGILWAITTVFMAWTWIPALRCALGKSRFLSHIDQDEIGMIPNPDDQREPEYVDWYEQLTALGFTPVGQGWMRIIDSGHHWMSQSNIRVFQHRELRGFAIVQREAAPLDVWYSVTFIHCMTDGGMVMSSNFEMPAVAVHPLFISGGMKTADLNELLTFHQAIVANEVAQYSRTIDRDLSIEWLDQGLHGFFEHIGHARVQQQARKYLLSEGLIHVCVSLPAGLAFGFEHWGLPLCNLILYGALRLGEFAENRRQAVVIVQFVRNAALNRLAERRAVE